MLFLILRYYHLKILIIKGMIIMQWARYTFSLCVLWTSFIGYANDSSVAFKNSELTYQTNENIEMQKERLTITEDKVHVEYVFFNHGPEVVLDVAFPLPASPTFEAVDGSYPDAPFWDPIFESSDHLDVISGLKDPGTPWFSPFVFSPATRPFADFTRGEEGKRQPYEWRIIARDRSGKDITEALKRHKIPLSANYLNGVMDTPGLELHPEFVDPLKKLGLLVKEKADFQTQVIFHWKSVFPALKYKHTTHTYRPQRGHFLFNIGQEASITHTEASQRPHYHIFSKLFWEASSKKKLTKRWITEAQKQKKLGSSYQLDVYHLRYILTTGRNWKHGCIKDFVLTIPIPKKTEAFVLGIQGLKKVGQNLEVKLKDFSPHQELSIFYVRKSS